MDLPNNTALHFQNTLGSHTELNILRDHFLSTVVFLENQNSLPLRGLFSQKLTQDATFTSFLVCMWERKIFLSQRQEVPQSQASTTVERNTKEINIFFLKDDSFSLL